MAWMVYGTLSLFTVAMFYWNSVLRKYTVTTIGWFGDVHESAKHDASWSHEADMILDRSIPLGEGVEWRTDARFTPYSLIMVLTIITTVLYGMGVTVPILNYVIILGIPYLIVSGLQSHREYVRLYAEVAAVQVILQAKLHYDELCATEIQEILNEDE